MFSCKEKYSQTEEVSGFFSTDKNIGNLDDFKKKNANYLANEISKILMAGSNAAPWMW